ncbi:MAG: LysR family transcriptional regulator [Candidatus Riflebacteria bacterium]|nr:LysR family transcriptional regulator [Candidatus Riflebacteria bacterium]
MLDFTALRHFLAVAETRSFSRAAQKLFVTQPAVSHQIRRLEKDLGLRLFERHPDQAVLTDPGLFLQQFCIDLFNRLGEAEARVRSSVHAVEGTVRLACPTGLADCWLIPELIKFRKAHPAVDYRVWMGPDEFIRSRLEDRRLDLAIIVQAITETGQRLVQTPIYTEEYVLFVPGGSGRQRQPPPADDVVFTRPFVVFEENDYMLRRWLEENYPGRAGDVRIGHVVNHFPALIAMVKAGLGVAVLPRHTVRRALDHGELTEVPAPKANPLNRFSLAYHRQEPMSPKLEKLVAHLGAAAQVAPELSAGPQASSKKRSRILEATNRR